MPLQPGTTLGPYQVTAKIGEGGMGEVYQARDTTLDRDVALKALPEAFTSDPDRLARFEREAKVLASLNHPNIGSIYGLEEAEGVRALVLELVEGPTLADRIKQGPIPIDEALPIAKQIAEALEAAHERGVIHRDLKPANIKVKDDGTVKVLDFGLAKAFQPDASDPNLSVSPTISLTAAATQMGMVIGTAAYMSPEQARGKPVDKRADVWAFGAVLYEMLTGQRAFQAEDMSLTLARVLDREPEWKVLDADVPPALLVFIKRCLQKDPRERIRDIGDVRLAMSGAFDVPAPQSVERHETPVVVPRSPVWRRPVSVVLIALCTAAVAGFAVWSLVPTPDALVSRFEVPGEGLATLPAYQPLALSPDGRTLVFVGIRDGVGRLYRRSMDKLETVPIRGTEDAVGPFFSPDGEWVGFWTIGDALLKKVSLTGGPPTTLTSVAGFNWASWGPDDTIVFGGSGEHLGLWLVADAGGAPQQLTVDEAAFYVAPHFLPDGRAVLFASIAPGDRPSQVVVHNLETGEQNVLVDGHSPRVTPTGHLLFTREDSLWAAPFDTDRLGLTGEPAPVLEGVRPNNVGLAQVALGSNGTLVYVASAGVFAGNLNTTLVSVGRDGTSTPLAEVAGDARYPRFSPDGSRLAFGIAEGPRAADDADLWVLDIERGTRTRLTFEDNNRFYPTWSPDGTQLAFAEGAGAVNRIMVTQADGSGEPEALLDDGERQFPMSWAPDGSAVALYRDAGETGRDLYVLPLDGDGTPVLFLSTPFQDRGLSFSPNGQWLAYVSAEAGRDEIYVRPYPGPGGEVIVSTGGGQEAVWGPDGTDLFYRNADQMMVVAVETEDLFSAEAPRILFEGNFVLDNAPVAEATRITTSRPMGRAS